MTPQKQLYRHNPAEGLIGDCYRTCVAAILDLAPEEVPHVFTIECVKSGDGTAGDARMAAWLKTRGLRQIVIVYPGENTLSEILSAIASQNPGLSAILTGESRNACNHAVVIRDGEIVCDPSLDNSGIVGPADDGFWWVEFIGADV